MASGTAEAVTVFPVPVSVWHRPVSETVKAPAASQEHIKNKLLHFMSLSRFFLCVLKMSDKWFVGMR